MINISKDDLNSLERIGSGTFGCVYKKDDDTVYKIYYKNVSDHTGFAVSNPCLYLPKRHFNSLKARLNNVDNVSHIKDFIYVDGAFGGISLPYYEGETLNNVMDYPLKLKIDLSKQMIKINKDLTKKLIYKTDHKLNNMVLSDNKVKFIDLDDVKNHPFFVPDLLFRTSCINGLGETVQTFFKIHKHLPIPISVSKDITREKWFYSPSYKRIDKYMDYMEEEKNIIFINSETDISKLKELLSRHPLKIVYVVEKKNDEKEYLQIINKLKEENIQLFDFTIYDKMKNYSDIENVKESYLLSNKELLKIPQKN